MLHLLMTIGPQGAGKSSFIDAVHPDQIFSPDRHLMADTLYRWTPEDSALAWHKEYLRFGQMLGLANATHPQLWAWDATFPTRIGRSAILGISKGFGARVIGLYFKTPLDVCLSRNAARTPDRRVPEEKLREAVERLEIPRVEEGFDGIIEITPGDYVAVDRIRSWKK